ncbi:hypothetical protein BDN67DRAFT_885567, partial [Paxillus ammoniavirescens]
LGHISLNKIRYMARHNLVSGLDLQGHGDLMPCEGCAKGKHHRAPFPFTSTNRVTKTLECIHMDLQGPFNPSILGLTYTLAVIDDHS